MFFTSNIINASLTGFFESVTISRENNSIPQTQEHKSAPTEEFLPVESHTTPWWQSVFPLIRSSSKPTILYCWPAVLSLRKFSPKGDERLSKEDKSPLKQILQSDCDLWADKAALSRASEPLEIAFLGRQSRLSTRARQSPQCSVLQGKLALPLEVPLSLGSTQADSDLPSLLSPFCANSLFPNLSTSYSHPVSKSLHFALGSFSAFLLSFPFSSLIFPRWSTFSKQLLSSRTCCCSWQRHPI